jgi:hypothetical protein
MSVLELRNALRAQGGTLGTLVLADTTEGPPDDSADSPPRRAAHGPRATAHAAEYELLLEMILEGSLLHYGTPRVVHVEEPDLALLLGDQLYALGLSRLAELGDLEAVSELADLISLLAQARAAADAPLADAIWEAGATAIGWGRTPRHEAAKALARGGDPAAVAALLECARRDPGIPQRTRGM